MTEPSLARCCSLLFFPQDRERGEEYFQHGHVNLIEIGDCGIHAIAHGQSEYNVYIDFSELEDRNIGVHCDCPRFQGGDLCKHLWATLRYLDFVGYPFESEGSVAIYTLDFDKFDTGERILLDPKKSRNTAIIRASMTMKRISPKRTMNKKRRKKYFSRTFMIPNLFGNTNSSEWFLPT